MSRRDQTSTRVEKKKTKDSWKRPKRPSGSSSFSSGRTSGAPRSGSSRKSNSMATRKFNPSDFIKKVEETTPAPTYTPKHMFADFAIDARIKENIAAKGYIAPTAIQDQVIPVALEGKDIIATANTGTGKTAAFLIPLVHNVITNKIKRALIMAPTRELAAQIVSELNSFMAHSGHSAALCIGGVNITPQILKLRKNPAFIIGTPGRLKDLMQQNALNLATCNAVVLDEVDTMLDMGFLNDITFLLSKVPQKRQSLFFSATVSPSIRTLTQSFLTQPVSISVETRKSAEKVNQDIIKVNGRDKIDLLHDLLIKPGFDKVIIFARTKRAADKLAKKLIEHGFEVAAIHGDKSQAQRTKALAAFKNDKVKILLATDVVARGIDIDDVTHVINFDLPATHEDYIHRIGRTGRADKVGQAITFVD